MEATSESDERRPIWFLICSRSRRETQAWAKANGIPPSRYRHAGSAPAIEGERDFAVVRLRSFFGRPDAEEIERTIQANEWKRPPV